MSLEIIETLNTRTVSVPYMEHVPNLEHLKAEIGRVITARFDRLLRVANRYQRRPAVKNEGKFGNPEILKNPSVDGGIY
jgi:hypothetical protein